MHFATVFGQQVRVTYYNNALLFKEVSEKKAKYSKTDTHYPDGTVESVVRKISINEIERTFTLKADEQTGTWISKDGNNSDTLDYNFKLEYTTENCKKQEPDITDLFADHDSLGYIAPKISGENKSIIEAILKNVRYPANARENGITGRVFVKMEIAENGRVENIKVLRGAAIMLDKESVRVARLFRFKSPAKYKGQDIRLCLVVPFNYSIR